MLARADPAKGGDQLSMDRLRDILRQVDLTYLLDRDGVLEHEINWEEVLSLGEKQRLAMARLIFAKPNYAILDGKSAAFHEPLALVCCCLANQQAVALRVHERGLVRHGTPPVRREYSNGLSPRCI